MVLIKATMTELISDYDHRFWWSGLLKVFDQGALCLIPDLLQKKLVLNFSNFESGII